MLVLREKKKETKHGESVSYETDDVNLKRVLLKYNTDMAAVFGGLRKKKSFFVLS